MFNIALFGCGRIGKVHALNIDAHPLTQIKAVIDPYHEGAAKLADEYDAEVMTTEEAMADPDIHAVVICSATDTHADLIEQAAIIGTFDDSVIDNPDQGSQMATALAERISVFALISLVVICGMGQTTLANEHGFLALILLALFIKGISVPTPDHDARV